MDAAPCSIPSSVPGRGQFTAAAGGKDDAVDDNVVSVQVDLLGAVNNEEHGGGMGVLTLERGIIEDG